MLTDIRAIAFKSVLGHLVDTALPEPSHGEEPALDLIEFIGLLLRDRGDIHVFRLGLFVRKALGAFLSNRIARATLIDQLTAAAIAASARALRCSSRQCRFPMSRGRQMKLSDGVS